MKRVFFAYMEACSRAKNRHNLGQNMFAREARKVVKCFAILCFYVFAFPRFRMFARLDQNGATLLGNNIGARP
jgi:hypothetical protein